MSLRDITRNLPNDDVTVTSPIQKVVRWKTASATTATTRPTTAQVGQRTTSRDQPTWANCKQRPVPNVQPIRAHSAPCGDHATLERKMSTNRARLIPAAADRSPAPPDGRELLRRHAKQNLQSIFPTRYRNFDVTDLADVAPPKGRVRARTAPAGSLRLTEQAAKALSDTVAEKRRKYMFAGTTSAAYRRPGIQYNLVAAVDARRSSEPALHIAPPPRPLAPTSVSAWSFRTTTSSSRSSVLPSHLHNEWRSDIMTKYASERPWLPRGGSTTRYFPRHGNLQDVHLRNPYLVPNCVLPEVSAAT